MVHTLNNAIHETTVAEVLKAHTPRCRRSAFDRLADKTLTMRVIEAAKDGNRWLAPVVCIGNSRRLTPLGFGLRFDVCP